MERIQSPKSNICEIHDEGTSSHQNDPGEKPKFRYGIIYLSYVPDGLTVKGLREIMNQFGEVGRIFLEPNPNNASCKKKRYTEGWVEFKKKRVAKIVAKELNGSELSHGKKHSIFSGQIWSIKYLHKFKWHHLTDQLEEDRATREEKRRSEISHSKKQADFYQKMTERSQMMKRKRFVDSKRPEDESSKIKSLKSKQKKPTIQGRELSVQVDTDLLNSIFKRVS